jgi:hypothetical protein
MRDVDTWVRPSSSQMLFVCGQNDPWSIERFTSRGGASGDSALFAQKGGTATPAQIADSASIPTDTSLRTRSTILP